MPISDVRLEDAFSEARFGPVELGTARRDELLAAAGGPRLLGEPGFVSDTPKTEPVPRPVVSGDPLPRWDLDVRTLAELSTQWLMAVVINQQTAYGSSSTGLYLRDDRFAVIETAVGDQHEFVATKVAPALAIAATQLMPAQLAGHHRIDPTATRAVRIESWEHESADIVREARLVSTLTVLAGDPLRTHTDAIYVCPDATWMLTRRDTDLADLAHTDHDSVRSMLRAAFARATTFSEAS